MRRRRFLSGTLLASGGVLAMAPQSGLLAQESLDPGQLQVNFLWNPRLAAHTHLRVLASRRADPPAAFAEAVKTYRYHLGQVREPRIWITMEAYLGRAENAAAMHSQLTGIFPLEFREFNLSPLGGAVAEAVTQIMPAFEEQVWSGITAAREQSLDALLSQRFAAERVRMLRFLFTSLNAGALTIPSLDIHMVGRYILTGSDTREIGGRYFTLVETERFTTTGVLETVLLMIGRIIELEDRGNARGAIFLLRQRQQRLNLPNPALFPRALLYWTAGEAVRRSFDPTHKHVGETLEIYQRGLRPFLPALREIWNPYLDGKLGLDEAITGMIDRVH